jgi:hypothetical protein
MASEMKRWEMYGDTYGGVEIAPMPNGDWVKHEDHAAAIAAARAEVARLEAREPAWRKIYNEMTKTIANLGNKKDENEETMAEKDRVIAKLKEQRNWALKFDVRFKDEQELYEAILRDDAEIEAIERGET